MMNKTLSRRSFFKEASKTVAHGLGVIAIPPFLLLNSCDNNQERPRCLECAYGCITNCYQGCDGTCSDQCVSSCEGSCKNSCEGYVYY